MAPIVFEVRLAISSLFSVDFMCLILPTQKFILEKSAKIKKF